MDRVSGQVAYILERRTTGEEPRGSVLDSTLLFWVNDEGTGNHKLVRNPYMLAAGKLPLDGGGTLQTGRFLKYPGGTPHTGLLTVIGQIMGLKINSFGKPEWNRGPLPGVI